MTPVTLVDNDVESGEFELQQLREENELLQLQLDQLQEELEHYHSQFHRLDDGRESNASNTAMAEESRRDGDRQDQLVYRGNWNLVRRVMEFRRTTLPSHGVNTIAEVVMADPLFRQQIERAERAEARLRALEASMVSLADIDGLEKAIEAIRAGMREQSADVKAEISSMRDAFAPIVADMAEAKAVRDDLSLALKLQAIRDGDLRELQRRYELLYDEKSEQGAVMVELRDKLRAASVYLEQLRDLDDADTDASRDEKAAGLTGKDPHLAR